MCVKLLSQALRQHFVNSEVGKEQVVLLKQPSFVFVLFEISFQFVKSVHLGDCWDFQTLDLVFEGSCGVLDNQADARVLFLTMKSMGEHNLERASRRSLWNACESERHVDKVILVLHDVGGFLLARLVELLQSFDGTLNLLDFNRLHNF